MSKPYRDPNEALRAAILARLPGVEFVRTPAEELEDKLQSTPMGMAPFGHAGEACHAVGWTVFPQERDGKRAPGKFKGVYSVKPSDWNDRRQTNAEVADMAGDKALLGLNVAAVMSARNGCWVLDLDIPDPELADRFADLAQKRLGHHFLRRYHQSEGKLGLIYRTDPTRDPVARKRAYPILTRDGAPTGHAVEVISSGSPYTILGRHWKRGSVFQYEGLSPVTHGPRSAASVTATQLQAFLEEASQEIALLGKLKSYEGRDVVFSTGAVEGATVDVGGLVRPGGSRQVANVVYGPNGRVIDGREAYLRSRAFVYVLKNPSLAATDAGRYALAGAVAEEAQRVFDGLGDHFTTWHGGSGDTDVLVAARAKIQSAHQTCVARPDFVQRVGRDETTGALSLATRVAVAAPRDVNSLAWLQDDALSSVKVTSISVDGQDEKRRARAIVTDQATRTAEQDRVARELRRTISAFTDQTRAWHRGDETVVPVTLLKAPTGAGKTSLAVEIIADDVERNGACGPRLFLLPSYNNIDEVSARARAGRKAAPTQDYVALAKAAANEARARGLKVEILTGKERGGCLMTEQLAFLRANRQPANALCYLKERVYVPGAPEDAEPVYEETWCQHHPDNPAGTGTCPLILARRKLVDADIIFAPTVFLTNALPEGLKGRISGMVIDERCCFEMLHHAVMPLTALADGIRAVPALTAAEKATGFEAEGWVIDRDRIAAVAMAALQEGVDVASVIAGHPKLVGLVDSAITVCGRGQRSHGIKPNVSVEALKAMFQAEDRNGIVQEHRFWSLVRERVEALQADADTRRLVDEGLLPAEGRTWQARGDRDYRIQLLAAGVLDNTTIPNVRMAWRNAPNLGEIPTLLLDASADPAIIEKCWSGRAVETVKVDAYMHLRTVACLDRSWATMSLVIDENTSPEQAARVARDIAKVRRMETALAGIYGWGRFGTFAPKRVRKSIRTGHGEAENVDSGHYGATRGLDFAKDHAGVITLGRLEFPTWIYDAWAAALTYDDEFPELPLDVLGTGLDEEDEPIGQVTVERIVPLRDGRDLKHAVSEMPGRWGRAVQRQMREEEQLQCAGRLRPVYRDGEAPLWLAVSSVLPEGVVVDAVTTVAYLSDQQGVAKMHDAIRRVGVLDADLIQEQVPEMGRELPRALHSAGITDRGNGAPATQGLDAYVVRVDGVDREVFIPASAPDPTSAAVEAYDRSGHRVDSVRLVRKGAVPVPSQVRAPDAIDAEIGSRDERRAAEDRALAAARKAMPDTSDLAWCQDPDAPEDQAPVPHVPSVEAEAILIAVAGLAPEDALDAVVAARAEDAARAARRIDGRNPYRQEARAFRPDREGESSGG